MIRGCQHSVVITSSKFTQNFSTGLSKTCLLNGKFNLKITKNQNFYLNCTEVTESDLTSFSAERKPHLSSLYSFIAFLEQDFQSMDT